MKKIQLILIVCTLFATSSLFAAWGYWDDNRSQIKVGGNWYNMVNTEQSSDFNGYDFGELNPSSDTLDLQEWWAKTWKNSGGDVTDVNLNYRVYISSAPSFTLVNHNFVSDLGSDNQKWGNNNVVIDVIDGLPNGSYTFEVYGDATGTTPTATLFDSNGGANFKASFIITPEPGMVILFGLALLFFRKIWT